MVWALSFTTQFRLSTSSVRLSAHGATFGRSWLLPKSYELKAIAFAWPLYSVFKSLVEDNSLEYFDISGDPAELKAFMVKNPGLILQYEATQVDEISKRRGAISVIIERFWRSCVEGGDGSLTDRDGDLPSQPRPFFAIAYIYYGERLKILLQ